MELLEDNKRLKILIRIGIVLVLGIQLMLMILEYVNFSGQNYLLDLDFLDRVFIIYKGDTTTWFHSGMLVDYGIYGLIAVFTSILLAIDNFLEKNKISAIMLAVWVTMAGVNVASSIILSYSNGYGLSLMVYQKMFLTLQFLRTDNILIGSCLGILFLVYVCIHLTYFKYVAGKIKMDATLKFKA